MTLVVLDETQQDELDRTGSLCGSCLSGVVKQLLDLYDAGDITAGGALRELRAMTGAT
jgi:hypothetical protein